MNGPEVQERKDSKLSMKISELLVSSGWWKLAASVSCPWKVVELKRPKHTTERTYISDVSMKRASARDTRKLRGKRESRRKWRMGCFKAALLKQSMKDLFLFVV